MQRLHAQALVATTMAFGVANRVLYKMALVPLGDYVFFLAQFQTFGYSFARFPCNSKRLLNSRLQHFTRLKSTLVRLKSLLARSLTPWMYAGM